MILSFSGLFVVIPEQSLAAVIAILDLRRKRWSLRSCIQASRRAPSHFQLGPGSCVLQYRGEDDLELNLVGWRGTKSLRAYVDQHDTVHMLRLLGADVSKYEKNKFEDKKEPESDKATEDGAANDDIPEEKMEVQQDEAKTENGDDAKKEEKESS